MVGGVGEVGAEVEGPEGLLVRAEGRVRDLAERVNPAHWEV